MIVLVTILILLTVVMIMQNTVYISRYGLDTGQIMPLVFLALTIVYVVLLVYTM